MRVVPELQEFPDRRSARRAVFHSIRRMRFRICGLAIYGALVFAPIIVALDYHYRFLLPILRPLIQVLKPLLQPLSGPPILTPYGALCALILLYGVPAVFAPAYFRWLIARFRMLLRIELNRIGIVICVSCAYDLRGLDHKPSCPECGSPNPPVLPPEKSRFMNWLERKEEVAPRTTIDNIVLGWLLLNVALIFTRALELPFQAPHWLLTVSMWLVYVLMCYSAYRKRQKSGGPTE